MLSTPRHGTITVSGVTGTVPPDGPHNQPEYHPHDPSGGWQQPAAYYTQPFNPPPPPVRPKGLSTGAILGICVAVMAGLCLAAGAVVARLPPPKDEPAAATATPTVDPDGMGEPQGGAPPAAAPTTTAPTTAAGPLTSFADGTHEVGTGAGQIPPGTYVAVVPDSPFPLCMWSRLRGFSGEGKDTITFGTGSEGEKMRVTISASDKGFESDGCGTWTKA